MKKVFFVIVPICLGIFAFTGCESKKDLKENKEYMKIVGINDNIAHFVSTKNAEQEAAAKYGYLEAMGNEKTESRTVLQLESVRSKPNNNAAVIGYIEANGTAKVIGLLEDGNWYKIVYNGRVAYINSECIEKKGKENIVSEISYDYEENSKKETSQNQETTEKPTNPERPTEKPTNPERPTEPGTTPTEPETTPTEPETTPTEPETTPTEPETTPTEPEIPVGELENNYNVYW